MRKSIILFCFVATCGFVLMFAGCKVKITVPTGGKVVSKSGAYVCQSGQECVIDIYDLYFDEEFIGQPAPGYEFVGWDKVDKSLCGNKSTPCRIVSGWAQIHPWFMQLLESDSLFFLSPVFFRGDGPTVLVATQTPGQHTPSGGLIVGDLYHGEYFQRHIIDPWAYDKATRLYGSRGSHQYGTYLDLLEDDEAYYFTKIKWFGYYRSKDLPESSSRRMFKITIYEEEFPVYGKAGSLPGKIIATVTSSAQVKPAVQEDGPYEPGGEKEVIPVKVHSSTSEYDGRVLYEYSADLGPALYTPTGRIWLSIVEIDNDTGTSNSDFVWLASTLANENSAVAYLTDYAGWLRGVLRVEYKNVVEITGLRSR